MISNCIFTWAITRKWANYRQKLKLWIDFKLYFYVSNHKFCRNFAPSKAVVNWFQIVFLREQSQDYKLLASRTSSCELISNCIFTWAITSKLFIRINESGLWIDFKLYFYVSNHKKLNKYKMKGIVVNWFQIVFLREQSQDSLNSKLELISCELISNCIFTWAITR